MQWENIWPFAKGEKERKVKEKRFKEEYDEYVKRKQRERKLPERALVMKFPEVDEVVNRLPVGEAKSQELVKRGVPKEVAKKVALVAKAAEKEKPAAWIQTGVPGVEDMLSKGIPKGSSILVAGGPGSGKTIFCLQTLFNAAMKGEKCLYISFEESEQRLWQHMRDFGWDVDRMLRTGNLKIVRIDPFRISRGVEAMLAKAKGELLIEMDELPELLQMEFKPDRLVLDSLSALGAAFLGGEGVYRIYIEQLFRYFEKIGVTSFLISETEHVPTIYSRTGVEEFLADGVFVFYNLKRNNIRVRAIEILKLRGAKHEKKIVPFEVGDSGITVFPNEPIFVEDEMKA